MGDNADRRYKGNDKWLPGDHKKGGRKPFTHTLESERTEALAGMVQGMARRLGEVTADAVYESGIRPDKTDERVILLTTPNSGTASSLTQFLNTAGYGKGRYKRQTLTDPVTAEKTYEVSVQPAIFIKICTRCGRDPGEVIPPARLEEIQSSPPPEPGRGRG